MARWLPRDPDAGLGAYDPAVYGPGVDGIRGWKRAGLAWLNADPLQSVQGTDGNLFGNPLAVIREACRLIDEDGRAVR